MDLFRDILPKTYCGDCGFSACLAFASMVASGQHPPGKLSPYPDGSGGVLLPDRP
ncbi:MAG: (Fe-S)-binding protein [Desulfosudaceae bacterium]